ncbi:sulfatase-like hydrolase/transferase [Lacipirellula sp.]|uniref:sulfatase-like hydrolase/transferase n=1 Tax=Lacipirellula sp. TaxID=2691419 RepID=UPI003D10430F
MNTVRIVSAAFRLPAFFAICFSSFLAAQISSGAPPNILLIVADDLGYGDVACFRDGVAWRTVKPAPPGTKPPATLHLDRLAKSGLMLTSFYANDAVCSPTRAALMTGRYQHRTGVINVLGQLSEAMEQTASTGETPFTGLGADETTIAELLQKAGYRTACIGKWHLGEMSTQHPMDNGFDHFVGTTAGAGDNFAMRDQRGRSTFWRDRELAEASGEYYTDLLANEAIGFIRQPSDQPFFVYLPFTAPHVPYFAPGDRDLAWDGNEKGPRSDLHAAYAEVVEALDSAVGRVLQALEEEGLDRHTLVVFTSDNGPVDYGSATPFRGRKTNLYEGGVRVPTIVSWPGVIKPGTQADAPAMSMDLFRTFAVAAEAEVPAELQLDGVDLTPLFSDEGRLPERSLFWERGVGVHMKQFHRRLAAIRRGNWKLVLPGPGKPPELYDLSNDPQERHSIATDHSAVVAEMKAAFDAWRTDVYADCPYDPDELILRLRKAGIIAEQQPSS